MLSVPSVYNSHIADKLWHRGVNLPKDMPGCLPASFSSFHWSWLLSYGKTFNNKCNTSDVNYFVSFILKKFRFSPLVSLYCGVESPEARDAQNDHTLVLPTLLYLLSQYRINCGAYGLNQSYCSLTYIFSVLIPVVTAEGRLVAFSTMAYHQLILIYRTLWHLKTVIPIQWTLICPCSKSCWNGMNQWVLRWIIHYLDMEERYSFPKW